MDAHVCVAGVALFLASWLCFTPLNHRADLPQLKQIQYGDGRRKDMYDTLYRKLIYINIDKTFTGSGSILFLYRL